MNDPEVDDLAADILDGADIDWESVESNAAPDDRRTISQLRVLSRIAGVYGPPPGPSWGPLRVFEAIGRGAFGDVYRAWDTRLDREVALKLLPAPAADDRSSSIIEEGRLLARVRHANVATIYGAERIGQRVGLWMELVEGRTLEQLLAAGRRFTIAEVVNIGVQLAEAIDAVHGAGLLHRDIKAQNVMLAKDGRAVLMDFGTGQELGDPSSTVAGTPLYLAPEVLCQKHPPSVPSDIYAVGVLLYRLLTNSYPVNGRTLDELRDAHGAAERPDLRAARPDMSERLTRTIVRGLHRDPAARYASASAFAADLKKCRAYGVVSWTFTIATAASVALIVGVAAGGAQRLRAWSLFEPPVPATIAADPVIAVLPFRNPSTQKDSDLFVDGLTDEIINNLAQIDGLQVRSRNSSSVFKNRTQSLAEIGRLLNANLLLEGAITLVGDQLRVNASLVQVQGDVTLWSETFDRELKDIFDIQDEISRAIVDRLRLALGRGQRRYNTNLDAYMPYLKARAYNDRRGPNNARTAEQLFQQAIAADRNYAPAYAGLAHAYAFMSITYAGIPAAEALAKMQMAADQAFKLDPLLAEANAAMGVVLARQHDWDESDRAFSKAIELNPALAQVYTNYAFFTLRPMGRLDEAERLLLTAREIEPESLDIARELAEIDITRERYDEAIAKLEGIVAIDETFPFAEVILARAYILAGRPQEALPVLDRGAARNQYSPHYAAQAFVALGRRPEAEQLAEKNKHLAFRAAVIYVALGDMDRAFEALERTIQYEPQRVPIMLTRPEMRVVRQDPRFEAFRIRHRLPAF